MASNWFVVTGGPSAGKTSLLDELRKKGFATLPEVGRTLIDEGLAQGLTIEQIRKDERLFQLRGLDRKAQLEQSIPKSQVTFFDRGMHDTLAYLRLYDMPIDARVKSAMTTVYNKVFLLEPLPVFEQDYARTESEELARKLKDLLFQAYVDYGMTPVIIPACPLEERVKLVLQHIPQANKLHK